VQIVEETEASPINKDPLFVEKDSIPGGGHSGIFESDSPDVADHWDKPIVRSWRVMANDVRVRYQEGSLASLLPPEMLMVARFGLGSLPDGTALFCGTQPVVGELLLSDVFEMELFDPVREKIIRHRYRVRSLDHVESD
jgi:hypothetical protein